VVVLFTNVFTNNDTYRYLGSIRSNSRQPFSRNRAIADKFFLWLASHQDRLHQALYSGSHSEQRSSKFFIFLVGDYA